MRHVLALIVLVGLVVYCVGCGGSSSPPQTARSNAPPPPPPAPAPAEQKPAEEQPKPEPKPEEPPTAEQPKPEELPPEAKTPEGRSMYNLKKLAEAMKAHHEKNGRFPAATTLGKDEKPLLSWRVQLLPFLSQEALYNEFHRDEPWDSEHNKPLVAKMPEIYKTPGGPEEGKTCYLVAAGMGTVFGQREGISKNLIGDGPDKTIMIVEADADRAVPWTQPQDLQYIPASPAAGLGALRGKAFLAAFADGTVRKLGLDLGQDLLRALFSINGREMVDVAVLDGKPGADGVVRKPSEGMLLQAEQYFAEGEHKRGLMYLMADGVIRGSEEVMNSVGWCPGLKRPILMVRFGLMIQGAQATGAQAVAAAAAGGVNPLQQEAIGFWGQAVGMPMLGKLESRVGEGMFGRWMRPAPRAEVADQPGADGAAAAAAPGHQAARPAGGPGFRRVFNRKDLPAGFAAANLEGRRGAGGGGGGGGGMAPAALPQLGGQEATADDMARARTLGIINLGINNAGGGGAGGAARRAAEKEGVDAMIIAAITAKIGRVRGKQEPQVQSTVTLRAVDVMRSETIWTSKPLSSTAAGPQEQQAAEGQQQTGTPTFARGLLRELFDFVDEQLAVKEMPPLTADVVRQRAAALAEVQYANPLPVLLELRYYEFKKLLTSEELSGFYAKIVGPDEGPRLATGPIEQRKEVVQRWLGGPE